MALIDITVKTLDGQNHLFSVPEQTTVRNFKDKISGSIDIPADTQRLIYRGRVMQDDKQLKDYDLHGKAIHVVQRAPPTSQPGAGSSRAPDNPQPSTGRPQPPDGGLLDVQIHLGSINADPTAREARNRIIQAELNIGIINDALSLLEERTGISSSGNGASEESQERMDTSQSQPEQSDSRQEAERETQGQSRAPNGGGQDNATGLMATELADVLDRVLSTNDRITPQLRLYRNYLRNEETYASSSQEARNAQEVINRVTEAMHAMSHVMHNLSDLMVDMNCSVPRTVTATPMSPFMTGGTSMAIPIHMNVRARTNGNGQRHSPQETAQAGRTTSATPSTASNTTVASSTSQSGPSTTTAPTSPTLQPGATRVSVVQDIHTAVVTSDDIVRGVDVPLSDESATTSIFVVSSSGVDETLSTEQPATTTTAGSTTSPSSAAVITGPVTRASSQPATSTTASFSYGPTTNVNIVGMPNVTMGSLPNVPGLPQGMLQNIVQNILGTHGIPPGHPVQVNLHPHANATVGRMRIPLTQQNLNGARSNSRSQQTPSSMDASTATRTNAATNTSQSRTGSSTSTTGTNTTANSVNPIHRNSSSIGTGTDPSIGTSSRSTNTPSGSIFIQQGRGRGVPFSVGPRPNQPRTSGQGEAAPRPPGVNGRGFVDVYLPCPSHHYHSRSARQMARNARNQGQQQQVPNLSTMVSGMVGDIIGQVGQARQSRTNGNQTSSGPTSTSSTATTSSSGGVPRPEAFNPMQMFATMMGGGTAPGGPGGQGVQGPFDLPSLIGSMMGMAPTQGNTNSNVNVTAGNNLLNQMGGTLADLFQQFRRSLDESNGDTAESSPIQALIETVAPHIRLTDIFSLVMGNLRILGQLRGTLRTFMEARIAEHGSMAALVQAAVDGIYEEISYITGLVQVRDGVDMAASVWGCLLVHLERMFRAILSDTPANDDDFGRGLYTLWLDMLAETIGLCIYCIQNGEAGFSNMLQQYMPHITEGLNPGITTLMTSNLQEILSAFHQNHPVQEASIMPYVASRSSSRSATVSEDGISNKEGNKDKEGTVPVDTQPQVTSSSHKSSVAATSANDVNMDTNASPSSQPPRAKVPRTHGDNDSDDEFVDAPREFTHQQPSPKTRSPRIAPSVTAPHLQDPQPVANGETSEQWQSVIPQEWIPVISRDLERQREQPSQPPLSDAYLQGLPAKRRRMMVLEHAGEMGNMPHYLPSSIARAAHAVGVEPISSEQNLIQEATEEKELQSDLEQEMQSILENRLSSDGDFNADRFPNSQEYFHKSKRQ